MPSISLYHVDQTTIVQETSMVQWNKPAIRPPPTEYPHQPQWTRQYKKQAVSKTIVEHK